MEVRKWLRQQSKDFYAAGFDAKVKRWEKCINVGREKTFFFQVRISIVLSFISICDLTLPRKYATAWTTVESGFIFQQQQHSFPPFHSIQTGPGRHRAPIPWVLFPDRQAAGVCGAPLTFI
jgi:hypothetical protein